MIHEGVLAKIALVPVALVAGAEAIQNGAEGIVLAAATVAALAYLWVKVVRPLRAFSRRVGRGIEHLETLPDFMAEVKEHFRVLDGHVEALADADRHRIKDALAGDPRSPVDRRAA
jgi:hypothetical protein